MEVTLDLASLFVSYGCFLGFSLAVVFLLLRRGNRPANIFLGSLLVVFSLFLLHDTLWEFRLYEKNPHWVRFTSPFGFLTGPLIYFYVKACVEEGFRFPKNWYVHGIPFVVDLAYMLPFWLSGPEEKMAYIHDTNTGNIPLELIISVSIKLLISGIYFWVSMQKVKQYVRHVKHKASNLDRRFPRWLIAFSSSLLFVFLLLLLLVLTHWDHHIEALCSISFLAFVFTVQVTAFVMPEIFYAFPEQIQREDSPDNGSEKYSNSGLRDEEKETYLTRILDHMKAKRPYLDQELTLAQLAQQLDMPSHHLSQVINERRGQNFMDFVNAYRVEEAKNLFQDPDFDHFTVLAIAYEVGFNSKSAFYNAFRKFVGQTPTDYRKAQAIRA